MPSLNDMILRGEVCASLRSKKLFYQTGPRPEGHISSTIENTDGPFWCVHTQTIVGPDGDFADTDRCRPGRSCCQTA